MMPQFTPAKSRSARCASNATSTLLKLSPAATAHAAMVDTSMAAELDSPLPKGTLQLWSMSQPTSLCPAFFHMSALPAW